MVSFGADFVAFQAGVTGRSHRSDHSGSTSLLATAHIFSAGLRRSQTGVEILLSHENLVK